MKLKIAFAFGLCVLAAILFLTSASFGAQGTDSASTNEQIIEDLVYGNHILYNEGVLDAFGHISVRDPEDPTHFYLSRSLAPSQVTRKDIQKYDMQCNDAGAAASPGYLEKFIHCAIYRARPDVNVVIHAHSAPLIPFGVSKTSLRPIFHMAGWMGSAGIPIFDIRQVAADTDILISNNMLGDALAKALGDRPMVLMRGHGETIVGTSIPQSVVHAYYAVVNAQLQTEAMKMGKVDYLTPGEATSAAKTNDAASGRAWDMFKARAGKIE